VLSISWGFAEGQDIWSAQAIQAVNEAFQAAAAMGVTVCCAAGDDGSRDQVDDGLAHCDFPASSAYVLACGGTTLQSSGNSITSETVWNDGPDGGATGGGISDSIALPAWQANAQCAAFGESRRTDRPRRSRRGRQRRSGNRIPDPGRRTIGRSGWHQRGGAAMGRLDRPYQSEAGTPVGFLNPLLYSQVGQRQGLPRYHQGNNDITGEIGGYSAGPGWDACTGLGSPNGGTAIGQRAGGAAPPPPGLN
jgi:kumamolisin